MSSALGHRNAVASWWRTGISLDTQTGPAVGAKARGLLSLPAEWVPPFVALSGNSAIVAAAQANRTGESVLLSELCRRAGGGLLLVRSDGPAEALRPGEGVTRACEPDAGSIAAAVRIVVAGGERGRPGALVQIALQPTVIGMLSNERRVDADPDVWLAEGEFAAAAPTPHTLIVESRRASGPLMADVPQDVLRALNTVAGHLRCEGRRRRVEWLWDGSRLWIVQADALPEPLEAEAPPGPSTGSHWFPGAGELLGDTGFAGHKVARWRTFRRLGWARPQLAVLPGKSWQAAEGHVRAAELIARLDAGPWVVRTDTIAATETDALLLPTSDPSDRVDALLAFMNETAQRLGASGLPPDAWAFLVSALVPCQVSAWVGARPDSAEVRVEALWGYPDGLLHLPHDVWRLGDGERDPRVAYKPACLLPGPRGWRTAPVPAPFDWQPTLDHSELDGMAALARQLADAEGRSIQLMILARVGGRRGRDALLPFHFTELSQPDRHTDYRLPGSERGEVDVRTPADLAALDAIPVPEAIRVRPSPAALRDVAFLKRVGEWATKNDVAITFSGSLLGHAFHLLGAAGATVISDARVKPEPAGRRWALIVERQEEALARVRSVPVDKLRQHAKRLLAESAYAQVASGMPADPQTVRAALTLADPPTPIRPGPAFAALAVLQATRDLLPSGRPGSVPLFMDAAPSEATSELPQTPFNTAAWPRSAAEQPVRLMASDGQIATVALQADGGVEVALPRPACGDDG